MLSVSLRHGLNGEDVEADGLGKRPATVGVKILAQNNITNSTSIPALADCDYITLLDTEGWGAVNGHVLVALLVTPVLGDVTEEITADDDGPVHLGGDDNTLQDTAADSDVASERAFLVDVGALGGGEKNK